MTQNSKYKVSRGSTAHGPEGEHHLIRGEASSMCLWHREEPNDAKPQHAKDYETLGYVIEGRAELVVNGQTVALAPGDSYRVPREAPHTCHVTETLTAVEVTTPATDR